MAHLCALKRTTEFTQEQLRAWYGVLCSFPIEMVNHAMFEVCMSETRFPEVGDLYQVCRRLWQQRHPPPYASHGTGTGPDRPRREEIAAIAERFSLPVDW